MAILNIERVLDQLRRWGQGFFDGAAAAQVEEAKRVMLLARDVYCPIDTGALRGTALVTAELRELPLASADIRFGDGIDYAVFVHERLDLFHQPPTQAKFLQRAVDELSPQMTVRIGEGAVAAAKSRAGTT